MNKQEKSLIIDSLAQSLSEYGNVYLADTSGLNAESTSALRRECFNKDVKLRVVKNTLLKNAFDRAGEDFSELYPVLKGATAVMFSEQASVPAKLIKEFRKAHDKPLLKGAYVLESVYIGDEELETLAQIKSKEELVADVIALLQSPAKNVISALQSGANILHGVLETLSEKDNE